MKQLTIFGISILSVFILCSISYQPIVADEPIVESEKIIIEEQQIIEEDCDCEVTTKWNFPIICYVIIRQLITMGALLVFLLGMPGFLLTIAETLAELFNCPGTEIPNGII